MRDLNITRILVYLALLLVILSLIVSGAYLLHLSIFCLCLAFMFDKSG